MSKTQLPDYPSNARIRYGTPSFRSGTTDLIWVDTEEKARQIAAGNGGNGSGLIVRRIRYDTYSSGNTWTSRGSTEIEEELAPVTEFNEDGKLRRKRHLEIINCKHKDVRTFMRGAGCQKWDETICSNCGRHVANPN